MKSFIILSLLPLSLSFFFHGRPKPPSGPILPLNAPPPTAFNSRYCTQKASNVYRDEYGPVLSENIYTCNLPPLANPLTYTTPQPVLTLVNRLCELFPDPQRLPDSTYSNLFWGMRALNNQTCIQPNEAREFGDVETPWNARWRLVLVNRGERKWCEWYREIANAGDAVHLACVHSGLGVGENVGGREALGSAQGGRGAEGVNWCMRYSDRGWEEGMFEERCLGVAPGTGQWELK